MTTYTHVGYRPHVGHVHCGAKLHGHRIPKAGKRHALTGGPDRFTALCGETVSLQRFTEFGDEAPPNVWPEKGPQGGGVTCLRCRKHIPRCRKLTQEEFVATYQQQQKGQLPFLSHVAREMAKGFADSEDAVYCPTHGPRRKSLGEARQVERDETCIYVCSACDAVCDPSPF